MAEKEQISVCERFEAEFVASPMGEKLGISRDFSSETLPLNGMRIAPENGTCGWYIWSGQTLSSDADFFDPLHVSHMRERCPELIKYLGLAPGWRFLIAPNHEDVWWDPTLLER